MIISKNIDNGEILLEKFNNGLIKLKKSGRMARILENNKKDRYHKQKQKWINPSLLP